MDSSESDSSDSGSDSSSEEEKRKKKRKNNKQNPAKFGKRGNFNHYKTHNHLILYNTVIVVHRSGHCQGQSIVNNYDRN